MGTHSILADADSSVITAAQNGDMQAYTALYAHYSNTLYTLIYRLLARRAQAEDMLQEVFVEVLRGINNYAGTGSFGGWLRSIAVNKCLTQLRSPWYRGISWLDISDREQEAIESDTASPPLDLALAMQTELESALRHLSSLSRAVVWLHDVEGYTHSEIGRLLGRTPSFSKSQLARAHTRLRELLTSHDAVESTGPEKTNSDKTNSEGRRRNQISASLHFHDHPKDETLSCTPATQSLSTNS